MFAALWIFGVKAGLSVPGRQSELRRRGADCSVRTMAAILDEVHRREQQGVFQKNLWPNRDCDRTIDSKRVYAFVEINRQPRFSFLTMAVAPG